MKISEFFRMLLAFLFLKSKRAVTPVITALIALMITIFVGVIVIVNLVNSVKPDRTWSTSANTTWASLQANTWVAFALLAIIPIVVGAVAILSYLRFGGK